MKGLILAAGFGTRFRPVTHLVPKPALPLCNRPLIGYAIEALVAAGVDDIAINLHHLPEQMEAVVRREYEDRARFHFSHEEEILGTGGAIRKLRGWLEGSDEFLIINGDTIQLPPLEKMLATHRAQNPLATLLLRHPPAGDRFTPVIHSGGRVAGFGESELEGDRLMFAGAHILSSSVLDELPDRPFSGITEDVYFRVAGEGRLAAVVDDSLWFDVGNPARYLAAHRGVLDAMHHGSIAVPEASALDAGNLVASSARSSGSLSWSSLGDESRVAAGARVNGSSIWSNVMVGNSRLDDSIVCDGAVIPDGRSYERALILPDRSGLEIPSAAIREAGLIIVPIT